jgi:hypothetical protein
VAKARTSAAFLRTDQGLRRLDSRVLDPVDRFMQRHPWSCSIPVGLIFGLGTTLEARGTTRWLMAIGVALFWTISFRLGLRRAAMRSARSSVPASKIPKA